MDEIQVASEKYPEIIEGYRKIVSEGLKIVCNRILRYGDSRYHSRELDYDTKMAYAMFFRKFDRIDYLTWNLEKVKEDAGISYPDVLLQLREEYLDAMNYAIMAIQRIENYIKEEEE